MLARILQARGRGLTIVFARTKRTAAKVADDLVERGFAAGALHGDLGQGAREQALRAFRHGKVDVLVATDVAARGIDVEAVTHVINYQCPEDEKTYLHRTGRTGRAGAKGTAVTFVDWDDIPRWGLIDKALGLGIPEPIESYSSSAHVYADLDIPEGTKGRLPKAQQTREGLGAEKLEDLGETGKRGGGRPGGSHSDQIRGNRGGDARRGSDSRDRSGAAQLAARRPSVRPTSPARPRGRRPPSSWRAWPRPRRGRPGTRRRPEPPRTARPPSRAPSGRRRRHPPQPQPSRTRSGQAAGRAPARPDGRRPAEGVLRERAAVGRTASAPPAPVQARSAAGAPAAGRGRLSA